jgi:hypothetical protein
MKEKNLHVYYIFVICRENIRQVLHLHFHLIDETKKIILHSFNLKFFHFFISFSYEELLLFTILFQLLKKKCLPGLLLNFCIKYIFSSILLIFFCVVLPFTSISYYLLVCTFFFFFFFMLLERYDNYYNFLYIYYIFS